MTLDGFPARHRVEQRFGDLAPDGTTSTLALVRLFEHPRVRLQFPRFEQLVADGGFGPFHILLAGQSVERRTPFGAAGATVEIGTGIQAIGRTSYTYRQAMATEDGKIVATADATIVLATKSGPLALPDQLLADLEDLRLPESTAAAPKPAPSRRSRKHYPETAAVHARVGDVDLNRHVNYIAQVGWYDEAIAALPGNAVQHLPWRYRVTYLGEVRYPGTYDIGVTISGYDDQTVHYELGLFDEDRCLGTADASAPRGKLPELGSPA
ncbi:acyl-ACP thioesterase domain-containing protein [Amycolatopsis jejuensis]|uniref:acyl-ACP thioesterase domain-containing protein n=1 Tax=Amycolatopsis jejuensis TaxID=330084 RepID=UPI00068E6102|nr:acyl-ACP thioesterase domain-containing protein [Amycolatopsis jejuensis]